MTGQVTGVYLAFSKYAQKRFFAIGIVYVVLREMLCEWSKNVLYI